jgi:hypothetical protein
VKDIFNERKIMKKTHFRFIGLLIFCVVLAACGGQPVSERFPGTKDGAKDLLAEFLKPDADRKKMTMDLRPTKADYRAFYADEATADRAEAFFDKLWSSGDAAVAPKEGQTELKLYSATTEQLSALVPEGEAAEFPTGMQSLASNLKPNLTIYGFKFVKPGETTGMAFEGLTHINGKWRLFPKPWRFMEAK